MLLSEIRHELKIVGKTLAAFYSCIFVLCQQNRRAYSEEKLFGQLQRIGKALMLPVAILPAAGLLLAFGAALQGEQLQSYLPFIQADGVQNVAEMMAAAGSIILKTCQLFCYGCCDWFSRR